MTDIADVRAKEYLGITASETTVDLFQFYVTPLMSQMRVEAGAYVLVDHPVLGELCPVLARVTEMKNYEEVVGTTLGENKSVQTIASGATMGYVDLRQPDRRPLRRLAAPLTPGSKVYLPYATFLDDLFHRTVDGQRFPQALHLGALDSYAHTGKNEFQQLQFYLDAADFREQHFLLAAQSGTGKTHTAVVLVEELANKTDYPIVILDSYGEYTTVGCPGPRFAAQVAGGWATSSEYPFTFPVAVYAWDVARVTADLARQGLPQPVDALSVGPVMPGASKDVAGDLSPQLRVGVAPHHVTIIDARGLPFEGRQRLFAACVEALWESRVAERIAPFLLVVDEAEAMAGAQLARIAAEGRRRGCLLCLLTQHPTHLDSRILAQVSTHVVGRTVDARDLEYFRTLFLEPRQLLSLRRGEWIVTGITQRHPTKVQVRDRYSQSTAP